MMHRLQPSLKDYAWGSRSAIQEFTGISTTGGPLAEIWYGAHPSGPSRLDDGRTLEQMIRADGPEVLGKDVYERFGGVLPYLVKLIAPGQAVSLQVHPHSDRARAGYDAQLQSPSHEHLFVDPRHKPEQILALTPFEGLVGLRPVDEAREVLGLFRHPLTHSALAALDGGDIRRALALLAGGSASDVTALVALARPLAAEHVAPAKTILELAGQYPGDAGVAVSLLLRRVRLEPGDSVMVASGVPHAYMSGLALEVMANSDNVFRLGLTAKRVDVAESIANTLTDPAAVSRPHGSTDAVGPDEFHVAIHDLRTGDVVIPDAGPRILVGLDGETTIDDAAGRAQLGPGAAAFLPHGDRATAVAGVGRLAVVSVPGAA
ncbi:mannose-6-phosphate isomerase, class I [Microbacterium aurantiacum]|uniref:mannose-6-phosphate isomerase, class I n=1 Tax=Microbacterium aurantiacum TaxID=162393 RepID=UPI003D73AB6A